MRVVSVSLGERSYQIKIEPGILGRLGAECAALGFAPRCAVISDARVFRKYGLSAVRALQSAGFEPALVKTPSGEAAKSLRTVEFCCDQLARHRLERKSFIIALGGGVVGDLAGFVAASFLRGIPFVQVPTTLLAQVDSSVGGKVGVNLKAGKNLVGAFHQPRLVLCDPAALKTLPAREYRAGLAEVIKYAIIHDAALFQRLEAELDSLLQQEPDITSEIIERCCQIKAEIVAQDETESGLRSILNFGHTIGHALEACAGYGKYLHGEAISIGQVIAARLSAQVLGLPENQVQRIITLFARAGLPTTLQASHTLVEKLLQTMKLDKKVSAGEVRFVLAREIGKVEFGQRVPEKLVRETLLTAIERPRQRTAGNR